MLAGVLFVTLLAALRMDLRYSGWRTLEAEAYAAAR